MKVETLMVRDVVTCHKDTPLTEIAQIMWHRRIGFMPVIEKRTARLLGVVTDRDALMAAYTQGLPLWMIPAEVAMKRGVKSCRADAPIEEAEQLMGEHRFHRLPVVDESERLLGVISIDDIARRAAADGDEELAQEVGVALGAICRARDDSESLVQLTNA